MRLALALSLSLCVAPAFADFGGTVVDLSGTPVAGAVVKVAGDSVRTIANGTWLISRAMGIQTIHSEAISVASHLEVERGRIRIRFGGFDVTGRGSATRSPETIPAVARSLGTTGDSVAVYWKGKRLVLLPVPSESLSIRTRIDTAWSDDHGIPWNASIPYGSVVDSRDRHVYRTVTIGSQKWMGENLDYAGNAGTLTPVGVCYDGDTANCQVYGHLYSWTEVMGVSSTYDSTSLNAKLPAQGICPTGWHVPSDAELRTLARYVDSATSSTKLKAVAGWSKSGNGTDVYGFRALPAGSILGGLEGGSSNHVGYTADFWSSSDTSASFAWSQYLRYDNARGTRNFSIKSAGNSLRCVEGAGDTGGTSEQATASPTFSPAGGSFANALAVVITSATSGASIYYTTDGSTPTTTSSHYTVAIVVSASETIKAIAVKNGVTSPVASARYAINANTSTAIPWNSSITYGTLHDSRDGKTYRTVKIGDQTWMAENLAYATYTNLASRGVCSMDSCSKYSAYGRLYTWAEVMDEIGSSAKQGICPMGWHVPSDVEWQTLEVAVGMLSSAAFSIGKRGTTEGAKLKSTTGWTNSGSGTDAYGFRVVPAGEVRLNSFSVGSSAAFWTATAFDGTRAWYRAISSTYGSVYRTYDDKSFRFSLRCIQGN